MAKVLNDRINVRGEVDAWAKYAIERFKKELKKKKIGKSGELERSFSKALQLRDGDVEAVMIAFNMYGRFRDMGVGRGLSAYERFTNRANQAAAKSYGAKVDYVHRGAKRWFNKPKMSQIYKLGEILARSTDAAVSAKVQETMGSMPNITTSV